MFPEKLNLRVGERISHLPAKSFVYKELHQIPKVRLRLFHKRQHGVPQQMLHTSSPGIRPLPFKGFDQARSNQRPIMRRHAFERVVSKSACWISNVPIQVIDGQVVVQAFGQITMWVDQAETVTLASVLPRQIGKHRGFTGACLANGVEMQQTVRLRNAKRCHRIVAAVREANSRDEIHLPIIFQHTMTDSRHRIMEGACVCHLIQNPGCKRRSRTLTKIPEVKYLDEGYGAI